MGRAFIYLPEPTTGLEHGIEFSCDPESVLISEESAPLDPHDPLALLEFAHGCRDGFGRFKAGVGLELAVAEADVAIVRPVIFGLEGEVKDLCPGREIAPLFGPKDELTRKPDEGRMKITFALFHC